MKKTLVIGASLNPTRYSNIAIKQLVSAGHEVVALGLKSGEVAGILIHTKPLIFNEINTVTLYINPKNQEAYYAYIVTLRPKRVIFNPGTENPHFYAILEKNKIAYEVACTLVLLSTKQY